MKIAFLGTPKFVTDFLDYLKNENYKVELVVTGEDKLVGRGLQKESPAPKKWADKNNILCLQPNKLSKELIEDLSKQNFDLFIVIAYGKILPLELINLPKFGTINVHYSLLPKWRGATPVESVLLNGEEKTGVSIQHMVYELDAGPIISSKEINIEINDNKETLFKKLNDEALSMLVYSIEKLKNGEREFEIQDINNITTCKKIKKEDGLINLTDDNRILYNKWRAYFGWPGLYFFDKKGGKQIRVKINDATFENGKFIIKMVTPEGKKKMSYRDYLSY
jgi:methionyl-tRNA formyltransferase